MTKSRKSGLRLFINPLTKTYKQAYTKRHPVGAVLVYTINLAVSSEFLNSAIHLFLFGGSSCTSVAAILPPQTPYEGINGFLLGCHRSLCLARLLKRSGCRFVTFFESPSYVHCSFRSYSHKALLSVILFKFL